MNGIGPSGTNKHRGRSLNGTNGEPCVPLRPPCDVAIVRSSCWNLTPGPGQRRPGCGSSKFDSTRTLVCPGWTHSVRASAPGMGARSVGRPIEPTWAGLGGHFDRHSSTRGGGGWKHGTKARKRSAKAWRESASQGPELDGDRCRPSPLRGGQTEMRGSEPGGSNLA